MSDADVHRNRPGYVYGIATHSSGQKEGKPGCSCPCHLADTPSGARGWFCDVCYSHTKIVSYPQRLGLDYSHEQAVAAGDAWPRKYMVNVVDYYFITKGNTLRDELQEHFPTSEDADAIASLKVPKSHRKRFDRYHALVREDLGWWMYDGENHPLTKLPRKPGRYAVSSYGETGTHWHHYETLDEVRAEIEGGEVEQVVDLDSGEPLDFTRTVSVYFTAATSALLTPKKD